MPPPGLGGDDESAHIERDDANIEALLSQRLQNLEDTVTVLANRQHKWRLQSRLSKDLLYGSVQQVKDVHTNDDSM